MKKTFLFASLILAGMVLLAGCQKDGKTSRDGKAVRFSVGTTQTRTSYSGTVTDGIERIDWVSGDQLRNWSDKATDRNDNTKHYADYAVGTVTDNGTKSVGTLNNAAGNGLVWAEEGGAHKFFAAYPATAATIDYNTGAATGMSIAASQSASGTPGTGSGSFKIDGETEPVTVPTVVLKPDMSNALMFAANTIDASASTANLDFYPAFTAFEISLVCGDSDDDIALSSFTLSSTSTALAGPFSAEVKSGNATTYTCPAYSADNNSITFGLSGQVISKTKGLTFTVFALPQALTNLKITFNLNDGTFRSLDLKRNGDFINFPACKKHRLTGIAMKNAPWRFAIDLGGQTMPWELLESVTTFTSQVAADPFVISNSVEGENDNYQALGNDPRYYQIRTLDTQHGYHFFIVTFTPKAPLGGYWWLTKVPVGTDDTADMFKVEVWDDDEGLGNENLSGPIMSQEVTLHIALKDGVSRDVEHSLVLKANFSPSPNIDDGQSADSEVQDIHKDGTFSWWKFTFPIQ